MPRFNSFEEAHAAVDAIEREAYGNRGTEAEEEEEEEEDEDEEEGRGEEKGEDEEEGTAMDTMSHATVGADSATIETADCGTLAGGELGADDECTAIPIERLRRDCDALADSVAKEVRALILATAHCPLHACLPCHG